MPDLKTQRQRSGSEEGVNILYAKELSPSQKTTNQKTKKILLIPFCLYDNCVRLNKRREEWLVWRFDLCTRTGALHHTSCNASFTVYFSLTNNAVSLVASLCFHFIITRISPCRALFITRSDALWVRRMHSLCIAPFPHLFCLFIALWSRSWQLSIAESDRRDNFAFAGAGASLMTANVSKEISTDGSTKLAIVVSDKNQSKATFLVYKLH